MAYKIPNVTRRRVKRSNFSLLGSKLLKEFIKKFPEHEGLTRGEFSTILRTFNEFVADEVVEHRAGVFLPEKLGSLLICSFPTKQRQMIDFGASNKAGYAVYHQNWGTDNKAGRLVYQRRTKGYKIAHATMWTFRACDSFKQKISKGFRENYHKYMFVDKRRKLSKMLNSEV